MPDTDFTPALVEVAEKNIQAGKDRRELFEWMLEPDHVENASLDWVIDWMNRRPIAAMIRLNG